MALRQTPTRATIRKEFTFEASHVLPNHDGKCSRLHGHSYKIEVFCSGEIHDGEARPEKEGMVYDFGDLSSFVEHSILALLDHRHLNDFLPFEEGREYHPPSAENIARWIMDQMHLSSSGPPVSRVRVWEGYKAYAEVGEPA